MTKFIFDLDGTVTSKETIPLLASHFGVEAEMESLTMETVKGNIPFIESFIRRVYILGALPVDEVNSLLETVPLYSRIHSFIKQHSDNCFIATGNLECWISKLAKRVGCAFYSSDAIVQDNKVIKLTSILRKENIVQRFKTEGHKVVFIGDGNNDVEAMRLADVSIAVGLTHPPAKSVLAIADMVIYNEEALCRQLNQLL